MYNKEISITGTNLGYYYFIDYTHPLATGNSGRVLLHRHVASLNLGRWLTAKEHVHHIDEDKLNNLPENLRVLSLAEHNSIHFSKPLPTLQCEYCGEIYCIEHGTKTRYCSHKCSTEARVLDKTITRESLDKLIPTHSWVALGKMFGYSDVGIKRRAKSLGCIIPVRRKT